jgi:hypothetical protein
MRSPLKMNVRATPTPTSVINCAAVPRIAAPVQRKGQSDAGHEAAGKRQREAKILTLKSDERRIGCASSSSVNSRAL